MRIWSLTTSRLPVRAAQWSYRSPERTGRVRLSQPFLKRADRRRRESHRGDEAGDVGVLRPPHRARDMRAAFLESREERVGEPAADATLARGGIDAEELEPAGRFLHPELATADLAEHEADDLAIDPRH